MDMEEAREATRLRDWKGNMVASGREGTKMSEHL
jgi:hypothetical protein